VSHCRAKRQIFDPKISLVKLIKAILALSVRAPSKTVDGSSIAPRRAFRDGSIPGRLYYKEDFPEQSFGAR
jgi:hypothetical protein